MSLPTCTLPLCRLLCNFTLNHNHDARSERSKKTSQIRDALICLHVSRDRDQGQLKETVCCLKFASVSVLSPLVSTASVLRELQMFVEGEGRQRHLEMR